MSDAEPWNDYAPASATAPAAASNNDDEPWKDYAPPQPSTSGTAGHWAGLTGRALAEGAAGLPSTAMALTDPLGTAIRSVISPDQDDGKPYSPKLSDFVHPERWQEAAHYFADKAGAPTPQTSGEKIYSKAVEALPSAALAPEAPIAGGISSMLGGGASQYVAEQGGSPMQQTAAGLVAGGLPGVKAAASAGLRGAVRGGEEGRQAMAAALDDARGNANLSVGVASGNRTLQTIEGLLSNVWGGGALKHNTEKVHKTIGEHINQIVDSLAGESAPTPMGAGEAILQGAEDTKTSMRAAEKEASDKQDALIPDGTMTDVSGVMKALNAHATPVPGAPDITAGVAPDIYNLRDQVRKTADKYSPSTSSLMNDSPPEMMPYDAVAKLKTHVGSLIDFSPFNQASNQNRQLQDVYAALAKAKTATAEQVSPEAGKAAADFNKLYSANSDARKELYKIVNRNGGPESVYQAAVGNLRGGSSIIDRVMASTNPDQQNVVRAAVLAKMGRAAGAPDAQFSANTFMTNWNRMSREAKDSLFGSSGSGGELRNNLDAINRTINRVGQGTQLKNPSGSGAVVGHEAGLFAAWEAMKDLMKGSLGKVGWATGAVGANYALSRALTSPSVTRWMAKTTKAPISALPNAVNQLSQMQDPNGQDLADYLQNSAREGRASGGRVSHDALVDRLIGKWKSAKRATDATTKPLLNVPDPVIVKALDIAQSHL